MHVTVKSSINWRFRSFESPSSKTIPLSLSVTQAHIELSTLDRYKNHIYLDIIINVSHKVCKVPVSPGLQDASAHRSQKCTIEKFPLFFPPPPSWSSKTHRIMIINGYRRRGAAATVKCFFLSIRDCSVVISLAQINVSCVSSLPRVRKWQLLRKVITMGSKCSSRIIKNAYLQQSYFSKSERVKITKSIFE